MTKYSLIEIYTSEDIHWKGKALYTAVVETVHNLKIAARCIVKRGIEGCYENGEVSTMRLEVLSVRLPMTIEILLPENELDLILPSLKTMVTDGIITVQESKVVSHRTEHHLFPRHLAVRDVMTKNPVTTVPDTLISDLLQILFTKDLYSIPIVDDKNLPVGIITETDLIKKAGVPVRLGLLSHFKERIDELGPGLQKLTAKDVMSKPVHSVHQNEYLSKAIDNMLKFKVKRLPVTDDNGTVCGILSIYDVFQTVTDHCPDISKFRQHIEITNALLVSDIMIIDCPKVSPDTVIEEVVTCIDSTPLQRVVVVDTSGKLLGLIFDHDLLTFFSEHKNTIWDHLLSAMSFTEMGRIHKEKLKLYHLKTASEIMRTSITTVPIDAPIEDAVKLIAKNQIRYLPVIDNEGLFRGIISRDELLKAV
jgi:CBS domain-containing protein/PII-like signaling protein